MGEFAGPRSLRQLLDAVLTVGSDLDLPAMLQRIVQSAVDLVEARYGALGARRQPHEARPVHHRRDRRRGARGDR